MNPVIVLHQPQDIVNIAVVIRAMRNFGARSLRLVSPAEFDPQRIEGIAHKSWDVVSETRLFDTLDEALGDCTHVVGLTARGRTVKRHVQRPSEAAADIVSMPDDDRVALLFGPEDRGLTNADLDRCHRVVTIPTTPENASLNLAQAATVVLYELFKAGHNPPLKRPRRKAPPADRRLLEKMFEDVERALTSVEFFKSHTRTSIMRTVRGVAHRAGLDAREASLVRAMSLEITNFLSRKGITIS